MVTSPANVWGGGADIPYLRPKAEPFAYSGRSSTWEAALPVSAVRSKLEAGGIYVGELISLVPLKRDETGRVLTMEVRGSSGTKVISGYKFRNIIGAGIVRARFSSSAQVALYKRTARITQSVPALSPKPAETRFHRDTRNIDLSECRGQGEKIIWMTKKRLFTTLELMEILSRPDDIDSYIEKGTARAEGRLPMPDLPAGAPADDSAAAGEDTFRMPEIRYVPNLSMAPAAGTTVKIYGRGSGHGVGLSQNGAKRWRQRLDCSQILVIISRAQPQDSEEGYFGQHRT
jgi:SpoIID/LytB domain protein